MSSIIHREPKIEASFTPICDSPKRPIIFFVKFTLQDTNRLILSYYDDNNGDFQETITTDIPNNQPPLESPILYLDPDSVSSRNHLRRVLQNSMSLHCITYETRVLRAVSDYVNNIIKAHHCPSDRALLQPNVGRVVLVTVRMERVVVYRDRVYGPRIGGPIPADEAAVARSLKRVRSGEYLEKKEEEDEKCGVCLEEFVKEDEEEVTCLPCEHAFHEGCIVEWLKISHFCPLCRFELPVHS